MEDNILEMYRNCKLCPRECGTDRTKQSGFCGESSLLSIETALLHGGEEPCISGSHGSGTVFFTGCSLRCIFCQNMEISQEKGSADKHYYTPDEFVDMLKLLVGKGAQNINFVTPEHFLPHIIYACRKLRDEGCTIPFVYNCSGYESIAMLELASSVIDIFLIDYKFSTDFVSKVCVPKALDYPRVALEGLKFLWERVGNLHLDENGMARSGLLIRHLVLPGEKFVDGSLDIINEIFFELGNTPYISLMSQYTPAFLKVPHESLGRTLQPTEYNKVLSLVRELGFDNVYTQEFPESADIYIPDFGSKKMFDKW